MLMSHLESMPKEIKSIKIYLSSNLNRKGKNNKNEKTHTLCTFVQLANTNKREMFILAVRFNTVFFRLSFVNRLLHTTLCVVYISMNAFRSTIADDKWRMGISHVIYEHRPYVSHSAL